jgi:hypothetical protein
VERYFQIARSNLKHNLLPHLLVACFFLLVAPLFMGLENLNAVRTAKVLEMYVALIGIILLTPVFLPEQNKEIRELVRAKYTKTSIIILIRILEAVIFLILLLGAFVIMLMQKQCTFPELKFFLGTLAEAVFLGGMGLCAYSIFDQLAVAYMLPIVYYIINTGGNKTVKDFFLYSMSIGSYREKFYLAAAGILLILIGVGYPYVAGRLFPRFIPHRATKRLEINRK